MDSLEMKKKLVEELMQNLDDAESKKLMPVKSENDTGRQTEAMDEAYKNARPLDGMKNAKGLPTWAAKEMGVENVKGDANPMGTGDIDGMEKPEGIEVVEKSVGIKPLDGMKMEVSEMGGEECGDKDMWEGLSNDEVKKLVRHYMES